jgi:hypothetical protein
LHRPKQVGRRKRQRVFQLSAQLVGDADFVLGLGDKEARENLSGAVESMRLLASARALS